MLEALALRRESVVRRLVQISLGLSAASYVSHLLIGITGHDHMFGLARVLDVDQEQSISTWFQVLMLAACAVGLWGCGDCAASSARKRDWRIGAAVVAAMSLDEQIGVHEQLKVPLSALGRYAAFHEYSWIVAGLLGSALVAALAGRFVFELPASTRNRLFAAAAIYLAGAVGLEAAAGTWVLMRLPRDSFYVLLPTLEELLEMAGMVTLFDATLQVIAGSRASTKK